MKELLTILFANLFLYCNLCSGQSKLSTENAEQKVSSVDDYVNFYQRHLSELRNGSCPMYPSCSRYTVQNIKNRGFLIGFVESTDRLLRCGHEHILYDVTLQENGFKLVDMPRGVTIDKNTIFQPPRQFFTEQSEYRDTIINEIASLINNGYHSEAIIQINKLKVKGDFNNDLVAFEMLCLNAMKRHEDVLLKYNYLNDSSKSYLPILKQVFKSHSKLGNYNQLVGFGPMIRYYDSSEYRVSQLKNQVIASYFKLGQYNEAETFISQTALKKTDMNEARLALNNLKTLKLKSPFAAQLLSTVLPGSGYIYSGHTMTGITALIVNGLLGYATYSSFKSGNTGIGILSGILNFGFYIGNIQGSGKSVKRYNSNKKEKIIKSFENKSILNN
jgi:putative component of membrane protein insertase Oxa1/YidC/SpoIIIJ protein YidD/TM2 domain-containing membrane protein YozV